METLVNKVMETIPMIKEIEVGDNDRVDNASVGIGTEFGFTGIKVVTHGMKQYEHYIAQDILVKVVPVGTMLADVDYTHIKARFNAIQYNLYSRAKKELSQQCFMHYEKGLNDPVLCYDYDLAMNDISDEVTIEYEADDFVNNLDYTGGFYA